MRIVVWTVSLALIGFWLGTPVGSGLFVELNFDRGIACAAVGAGVGFVVGQLMQELARRKKAN